MAIHPFNLARIMREAWREARAAVLRFGDAARQYLPACLRAAWDAARTPAQRAVVQRARVLHSIATLASDIAAAEAATIRLLTRVGLVPSTVVAFPVRPQAPAPAPVPVRRAA